MQARDHHHSWNRNPALLQLSLPPQVNDHRYQQLYDFYFTPQLTSSRIKFLEVGLGCGQGNVGASSQICECWAGWGQAPPACMELPPVAAACTCSAYTHCGVDDLPVI